MSSRRNVRELFNPDAFRAKRSEETVSIRKQKREEGFMKRRLVMAGSGADAPAAVGVSVSPLLAPQPDTALPPQLLAAETLDSTAVDPAASTTATTVTVAAPAAVSGGVSFAQLAADLVSPSPETQVAAVSTVRRILSTGLHFPAPLFFSPFPSCSVCLVGGHTHTHTHTHAQNGHHQSMRSLLRAACPRLLRS